MPPYVAGRATGVLFEDEADVVNTAEGIGSISQPDSRKLHLVWRNIILFIYLHVAALYGLYLYFTSAKWLTLMFTFVLVRLTSLGITAGVHRLWAHRSYKARWPLRLFLMLCNTLAFQNDVIEWVRDHRVHHKYSETDADPHNAKRGFFFSHIGWLMCRKHPDVKEKGKKLDMSDLYSDPVLRFQKNYYSVLLLLLCFVIPVAMPMYLWGESFSNSWHVAVILRYCYCLNATWLVNSVAHFWGSKPYDRFINPAENVAVSIISHGEGFHNYHHTFPWDYKTSELGKYLFNETTAFIDLCARLGVAYDLKTVPQEVVRNRVLRTGDGSHNVWGWGDDDQTEQDVQETIILARKEE